MNDQTFQLSLILENPDALLKESLEQALAFLGLDDFAETYDVDDVLNEKPVYTFYRTSKTEIEDLKTCLMRKLSGFALSFNTSSFSSEIWQNAWQSKFSYLETSKYIFLPPNIDIKNLPEKTKVWVDPNAFGTGEHATTKVCILMLENLFYSERGSHVKIRKDGFLDVGTGTGILAAWAERENFTRIVATDILEEAIDSAVKTKKLNRMSYNIVFDSFPETIESYAVIISNILPPELFSIIDDVKKRMAKESVFIISGFNESNENEVIERFSRAGFKQIGMTKERGWCAAALTL